MKKSLLLTITILFFAIYSRAQYVTIPDTAFVSWLNTHGYSQCLNGNQLDTTCFAVLNDTSLPLQELSLHDLTGIQYFKNLRYLSCYNDSLTSLPPLPPVLTSLICYNNQLTSLPALPAFLTTLWCDNNPLNSLPTLPSSLTTLWCNNNQLSNLPPLPASLTAFSCGRNQLTTLHTLPASLTTLYCYFNQLSNLPTFPASLNSLDCQYNQLTSLPTLPASLGTLNCGHNQLISLPTLPTSLNDLDCDHNLLLNLPVLPAVLKYLQCENNQLSSLPALSHSLINLHCDSNQLINLPILPSSLALLSCYTNQLTGMPALPAFLTSLYCGNNQLTSLPALPDSMYILECNDNPNLTCLPLLKHINYLIFYSTGVTCLPNYGVVGTSNPHIGSLPLCGIFNPNGCQAYWNISGQAYYDQNNDCHFNSLDVPCPYVKTMLYNGANLVQQTYSGAEGFYSFDSVAYGNYTVTVDTTNLPLTVACPAGAQNNVVLSGIDTLSYSNDFALHCRSIGFDLGVASILNNYVLPRPDANILVNTIAGDIAQLYGAHCAGGIGGTVQLTFTGPVTYSGVDIHALTPTAINGNTLSWNIADFGSINIYNAFNIILHVDASAQLGAQICITVTVTSNSGIDYRPTNNTLTYCFPVTTSYDPNRKEVYPAGDIDTTKKWLTYTVRFQNTGTASAEHIYVDDTLDSHFDLGSFQLLAYSHQNLTQILPGGVARFNFPNINLPDSTHNEPESHGYVQYKIKLKDNLPVGTQIKNTAYIYFDFNAPVVTNTTVNTITAATCTDTVSLGVALCPGDSTYFYGRWIKSQGFYDTLIVGGPCDSLVNLAVTVIDPPGPVFVYDTICSNDSVLFNGSYLTTTGVYTAHFVPQHGCDSVVVLNLTVNAVPVVTFTWDSLLQQFVLLHATYPQSTTIYCWHTGSPEVIDLSGGSPVGGVYTGYGIWGNQLLADSIDMFGLGTRWDTLYYIYTDVNGCSAVDSDTFLLSICEGINEIGDNNLISIYPNPANNLLYIKYEGAMPQTLSLYNITGQLLHTGAFTPQINVSKLPAAVYFVEVKVGDRVARKRFIKE